MAELASTDAVQLESVYMTTRERVGSAIAGAVAGGIAIPLLMRTWAPQWFVILWLVGYLSMTATMVVAIIKRPSPRLELVWSSVVGTWYSLIPISVAMWAQDDVSWWIAACLGLCFLAFEMTALPFVNIDEWRGGVCLVGLTLVVTGIMQGLVVVSVSFGFALFAMVQNAHRIRELKDTLDDKRQIAHEETQRARSMASLDPLTGLLNRRGLDEVLQGLAGGAATMLVVDANRFKVVNDTHGYAAGDQVLAQIAAALSERLPEPWVLGRQGGDEFLAVSPGRPAVPAQALEPIECKVLLHGTEHGLPMTMSGGLAAVAHDLHPDRLLSQAGYALRAAKRSGGGMIRFGGQLEHRFNQAIEVASATHDRFDLHRFFAEAQIIAGEDGPVGVEILARWRHPDGRVMTPSEFLPLLAENGLMPHLNDAMLERGIEFAARFNNLPNAPIVSVNVTASHLRSAGLVERVIALLERYRVNAARLMIEITESDQLDAIGDWESPARRLGALGVKMAIDDFGAGYSSIEHMNRLPISHLKFDRSFVKAVSGPYGEIMRGVVKFGKATRIGIIAEGIETIDELESMRAIGVDLFQGFYFGEPGDLDEVERQIIAGATPSPSATNGPR